MVLNKLCWIILFFFISTTSKAISNKIENYIFHDQSFKGIEYVDSLLQSGHSFTTRDKARLLLWKAEAFYQLGQYEPFYESTLVADSLFNASGEITQTDSMLYLLNYARYYHYLINAQKAHSYGKIARRIFYKLPEDKFLKYAHHVFHALGSYYRNSVRKNNKCGNRDTSLIYLNSALYYHNLYFKEHNYYSAIIHRSLGNFFIDPSMGLYRKYSIALNHYNKALKTLAKYYPENITDPSRIKSLMGLTYLYKGKLDSAQLYFDEVTNMLEKGKLNERSIKKYASTYLTNLDWYRNSIERSDAYSDTLFLKRYIEKLNRAEMIYYEYSQLNLNERCKCLLDIYRKTPYPALISANYRLWELTNNKSFLIKSLQLVERANQVAFQQFVMASSGDMKQKIGFSEIDLDEVQKQIKPNEAYLLYYDASDLIDYKFYAFLITKDQVISKKINYKSTGITRASFLPVLSSKSDKKFKSAESFKKYHYPLYQLLFSDIEKEMSDSIHTLKIIANNRLSNVNFETLLTDTLHNDFRKLNYLIRKYKIAYAASLHRSFNKANKKKEALSKKVFISPVYKDQNLINLENLNQKIKKWASDLSADIFMNDSLTVNSISQIFEDASFIHLNGHVAHLPGDEIVHYLNDKTGEQSAHLNLKDAFNIPLNNALVVHTACQSGQGKPDRNALPISFARAFLFSGAESVIYSKYPADENATVRLFQNFYQKISTLVAPSEAIHQAKLQFLESASTSKSANPYFWSTYQWLGETDNFIHTKNSCSKLSIVVVSMLSLLFLALIFIVKRIFPS